MGADESSRVHDNTKHNKFFDASKLSNIILKADQQFS